MKSGLRQTILKVLGEYGLLSGEVIGTVYGGTKSKKLLESFGIPIEFGTANPTYDYIYIPRKYATLEVIFNCLRKLKSGYGVLIYRCNINDQIRYRATKTYKVDDNRLICVIIKEAE